MKILMILESNFPPDVRVEKEIASLSSAGHQIILACSSPRCEDEQITWNSTKIIKKKMPKLIYKSSVAALKFPFYFSYWKKYLTSIFAENNFDAIHLHDLPLAKVAKELSLKYKIPFVLDLHENRPEIMKLYHHVKTFPGNVIISIKRWQQYQKKYANMADELILVTNEAKEDYLNKYNLNPQKVTVVPNFVDLDTLNAISLDNSIIKNYHDKYVVVYFGDTGLRRGTSTIIQAANLLKEFKEIHFLIIGNSREDEYLKREKKESDLSNVELTGWVPFEKAASYIKVAQIGLCPFLRNTHHDTTFANKMFQYMALGKPVIVSDCISQKNLINNEDCGLVFTAGNADDLAKKILDMKRSPKYNEWSKNSTNAVLNKYNWQNAAQKLIKVYENL